ncbi:MAG TPA: hypothetical protein VGE63_01020 [Candidatus Paceibacterota bacterium]
MWKIIAFILFVCFAVIAKKSGFGFEVLNPFQVEFREAWNDVFGTYLDTNPVSFYWGDIDLDDPVNLFVIFIGAIIVGLLFLIGFLLVVRKLSSDDNVAHDMYIAKEFKTSLNEDSSGLLDVRSTELKSLL